MGFLRRNKNEVFTQKQKWDYINIEDFKTRSCWSPIAYFFFFVNVFFGVAVVGADCYTAVNLLVFNRWSSKIKPFIPFDISKWIFAGCIIFSFVLMGFQALWGIRAIKSNSIARGYLDIYAQRWWCTGKGGYKRFLVFTELTKSKHGSDYVMLFTYFSFKGWAEVLFADGPRQVLNGITLYAVIQAKIVPGTQKNGLSGLLSSIKALEDESLTQAIILSVMLFTCVWWIFVALQLLFAILLWIMFIWHHVPSGHTLGSYCREKIDKRLVGIVAKNHKRTLEEEREERMKADKAGTGARQPTIPVLGGGAQAGSNNPTGQPTLPTLNEKPPVPGLKRTNTMDTFTTTVSSRPDTNMPPRPPYAARPPFSSSQSATSSMFDDSASLLGDRKDPFSRTNTPLNRPAPPIGPYSRDYNDSQASLTNPYESAPLQPHDFLGSSQALPPVNRNDTVSPFYQQRPPPVNRNDTISPLNGPGPMQPRPFGFDPMQSNTPQPFPQAAGMPRRFPVRPQDQGFPPHNQPPVSHTPSPAPEFSTYTEHRHTPPIHHKPESEVFEMDGGISVPSAPASGAIELGTSPPKTVARNNTGTDGFAAHPMAFELDTGVPVVSASPTNTSPQMRTRRLTPPESTTTPAPRSPPRQGGYPAYVKPSYQPSGSGIASTSTPPPQLPAQNFDREEHGVGRNIHGNYDLEADVLDSYLGSSQSQMPPPQQLSRPFAQNQGQGSRPSTPTRGLPVRRGSNDSYHSNAGSALGLPFNTPARSMTATPTSGYGGPMNRGPGPNDFSMPPRSMTAGPYGNQPQARSSPPRGNSGVYEQRPRGPGGPPPPPSQGGYRRNDGYGGNSYGGNYNGGW